MTHFLLPPRQVAARLPGMWMAVLLATGGPAFVAWAGEESNTGLRLLLVGVAAGLALALVWDDRCAPLTAATPTGLPSVRVGRGVALLVALAAGRGVCAVVADRTAPDTPVMAIAVPVFAMAVLLLAAVGLIAHGREGEPVGASPAPVLLLIVGLMSRLPERWSLLASPATAAWPQVRHRWLVVLAASAATVLWLARDPAARPLHRRASPSAHLG